MGFNPTIKFEGMPELQKGLAHLSGRAVDQAIASGFRATGKAFPGYMAQAMAKVYTPKSGDLKAMIKQPKITGGPAPTIEIDASAAPISGRLFKPLQGVRHQNKKNVSIAVFKGKRTSRARGFRNPSFAKGKPFVRDGSGKLPISRVMGPSFHNAFTGGAKAPQLLQFVHDKGMHKVQQSVLRSLRAKSKGFIT
jgi:hypothetical protein